MFEALRAGARAVLRSKGILLCVVLATAAVSVPYAAWNARAVHAAGAHRPDATEATKYLDPDFFAEVRAANPSYDADATTLVVASLVLAFLVKPLVWGAYAGIAAATSAGGRITFAKCVREGGSVYWTFLRISCVEIVLVAATAVATRGLLSTIERVAEDVPGDEARRWSWVAQGMAFAFVCLVAMVCDYARVAVRMKRRSRVVLEIGRAAVFVMKHPLRTCGVYFLGFLLEVALAAPVILLMRWADGAYVLSSAIVLVLGQLSIAVREAARLFHVAAAWSVRAREDRPKPGLSLRSQLEGADLLEERLPWHVS